MFAANRAGMAALGGRVARADGVTHMWLDIGIVVLLIVGIYCFAVLIGFERRSLTRRTDRRAEDMYDQYADSARKQRRYAREHGAWQEEQPGSRR
jgi:hypothetical protein